jgi:hypothetical protein
MKDAPTSKGIGMSTKSVAEKLLIKPNTTIWLSHAAHLARIEPLPAGVRVVDGLKQATIALVFADAANSVREILNLACTHNRLYR